jgi:hypothetical protein
MAAPRTRSMASSSSSAVPTIGITIYGCEQDEAVLFREMAPRFGVIPTITDAPVSEANVDLFRLAMAVGEGLTAPGLDDQMADAGLFCRQIAASKTCLLCR